MTDRLDEIRARAEAATPGPWRWRGLLTAEGSEQTYAGYSQRVFRFTTDSLDTSPTLVAETFDGHSDTAPPNAEFIAHARDDIPYLLAEVERLRAALASVGYRLTRKDDGSDHVYWVGKDSITQGDES
jgi:hypothetical protein